MAEGGALIRVELMTCQFATHHPTDGMDEVPTVEIFKAILIGIMGIGAAVELVS